MKLLGWSVIFRRFFLDVVLQGSIKSIRYICHGPESYTHTVLWRGNNE